MTKTRAERLGKTRLKVLTIAVALGLAYASGQQLMGQSETTSTSHPTDDAAASSVIAAFQKVVAPDGWKGLRASGSIVYGKDPAAPAYPVEVYFSADGKLRIDVQEPAGTASLRVNRVSGARLNADGSEKALSSYVVATGLIPWVRLVTPDFAGHHQAIQGAPDGDGSLRKLTVALPLRDYTTAHPAEHGSVTCKLSFAADSTLESSTCPTSALGSSRATGQSVISYSAYRSYGDVSVPTEYAEAIDGQLQWRLSLNAADAAPALSNETFRLER